VIAAACPKDRTYLPIAGAFGSDQQETPALHKWLRSALAPKPSAGIPTSSSMKTYAAFWRLVGMRTVSGDTQSNAVEPC